MIKICTLRTTYNLWFIMYYVYTIGIEQVLKLRCCKCEPVVFTMARGRIWPATPSNPHVAFTFELLDWAEALLLECQVAVKDLCAALRHKCPYLQIKVCVCMIKMSCFILCIFLRERNSTLCLLIHLKNTGYS